MTPSYLHDHTGLVFDFISGVQCKKKHKVIDGRTISDSSWYNIDIHILFQNRSVSELCFIRGI